MPRIFLGKNQIFKAKSRLKLFPPLTSFFLRGPKGRPEECHDRSGGPTHSHPGGGSKNHFAGLLEKKCAPPPPWKLVWPAPVPVYSWSLQLKLCIHKENFPPFTTPSYFYSKLIKRSKRYRTVLPVRYRAVLLTLLDRTLIKVCTVLFKYTFTVCWGASILG